MKQYKVQEINVVGTEVAEDGIAGEGRSQNLQVMRKTEQNYAGGVTQSNMCFRKIAL